MSRILQVLHLIVSMVKSMILSFVSFMVSFCPGSCEVGRTKDMPRANNRNWSYDCEAVSLCKTVEMFEWQHTSNSVINDGLMAIFNECLRLINSLTAKLFNLNFHPLEVVSRWRDPQLQVSENYSDVTIWRSTFFKYCWLMSHFIFNMFKRWYLMC